MNEIEADLADAMPLDVVEEESGEAEVLKVFQKGVNPGDKKEGLFAGCVIRRGCISTDAEVAIIRRGIQIYKTSAASLFYKADEIDYVDEGEFGLSADWSERGFLPGDIIKATTRESARREVEWIWS